MKEEKIGLWEFFSEPLLVGAIVAATMIGGKYLSDRKEARAAAQIITQPSALTRIETKDSEPEVYKYSDPKRDCLIAVQGAHIGVSCIPKPTP